MPKQITQYKVFIGSPGGLEEERKAFRQRLEHCSLTFGSARDLRFQPVGWEDVVGGVGQPQQLINETLLKSCDYAVFVLHERWGTETGNGFTSGTEEEWNLAEEFHKVGKIRNIALFFKRVDSGKLTDPGDQLRAVMTFKQKIKDDRRHLFHEFEDVTGFCSRLDAFLAYWLNSHENSSATLIDDEFPSADPSGATGSGTVPSFEYWFAEAASQRAKDHWGALFCATKAVEAALSPREVGRANFRLGMIYTDLGNLSDALNAFEKVVSVSASDPSMRTLGARARFNQAIALHELGRSFEAIAVYDDVLTSYGDAPELALSELVAAAHVAKGATFSALNRTVEAIEILDDFVDRFGSTTEVRLLKQVAKALFHKGLALQKLGRHSKAEVTYDELVALFGGSTELAMREAVAKALVNKGVALHTQGRSVEAIAVYDDVIAGFGDLSELVLSESVANALYNKRFTLNELGRLSDAEGAGKELLRRFGESSEPRLRAWATNSVSRT